MYKQSGCTGIPKIHKKVASLTQDIVLFLHSTCVVQLMITDLQELDIDELITMKSLNNKSSLFELTPIWWLNKLVLELAAVVQHLRNG